MPDESRPAPDSAEATTQPATSAQRQQNVEADEPPILNSNPEMSILRYLVGLAARMTVLFGLYVLSIGPMYWQWQSGRQGEGSRIIAAFYEPLYRLANMEDRFGIGETFGSWLNFYISLWVE